MKQRPGRTPARVGLPLLVVLALAAAAYANAIGNSFALDDVSIVVENPAVREIDLHGIFTSPYWARGETTPVADPTLYRPLTILSFALDHTVWGADASAFHAVNVVAHAATSALVLLLALEITGSMLGAFVAAAVFAVHPVHTESVTGIVGRADMLATLFFVLAFLVLRRRSAFAGGRAAPSAALIRSFLGALLWFAGLLSKETAATLPLLLAVDDWLHRDELPRNPAAAVRSLVTRYAPLVAFGIIYFILRHNAVGGPAHIWPGFDGVSSLARILTASRVLLDYILLLVFPRTLLADYWITDVPIATSLLELPVLLSVMLWLGIGVLFFRYGRRNAPLVLAAAWFFITIAPVSNLLFPIGVAKAERLLYLPSVGFCLLVGLAAIRLTALVPSPVMTRLAFAALLMAFTWRTVRRNQDWRDSFTLATATLTVSPLSPLMNDIAAGEFMRRGEAARALPLLRTAVQQSPKLAFLHSHLGVTYHTLGMPDEAITAYGEAIRLNPLDADALNNLGVVYLDRQQDDEALAAFSSALAARPAFADAHVNLGTLHLARGRLREAEAAFSEALQLNPSSPEAHNNLGLTLVRMGQLDQAADHYREALRLNPGFAKAQSNLSALAKQRAAGKPPP